MKPSEGAATVKSGLRPGGQVRSGSAADPGGRLPSIADVASFAGVSHQTVSRVLNHHPSVRDLTRARVLAAIDQLGYQPNTAARALASGRSKTLGVIAPTPAFMARSRLSSGSSKQRSSTVTSCRSWPSTLWTASR